MAIRVTNVTGQFFLDPDTIVRSLSDDLALSQETVKRGLNVYNVTFQALVPATPSIGRSVSQDVDLADSVTHFLAIEDRQVPSHDLGLVQEAIAQSFPTAVSTLELQQIVSPGLFNGIVFNNLSIESNVHFCFGLSWVGYTFSQELDLVGRAGQGVPIEASNILTLTDTAEETDPLSHQLNLQQFVSAGIGSITAHALQLVHILETESDFLRQTMHTDLVQQAFTYYVDDPCNRKTYLRFEGEGSNTQPFPEKRLQYKADFVLETMSGPKNQIVLRSPETDDRDRLGFNRVNRETRGGELGVFSDPNWAKVNTLLFTIVALKPDKITGLQTFLQDTLGQEILLQDWTGSTWRGVVTTPDEVATEDAEGFWTFSFEFEGEPFDGPAGNQALGVQDTLSLQVDYARSLSHSLTFVEEAIGGGDINLPQGAQDITIDNMLSGVLSIDLVAHVFDGAATALDDSTADLGGTWSAHTSFQQDGTMSAPVNSGAYLPFSPAIDKVYACDWSVRNLNQNILYEHSFGGAASSIDGVTPDTTFDSNTFHSAGTFLANGAIAGATGSTGMYLPFTPSEGVQYVLEARIRNLDPNGEATQDLHLFFGEGLSSPASDTGPDASGLADPTTLKAGQVYRSTNGNNGWSIGDASDGEASQSDWSDATLRDDNGGDIDLRVSLDTTGGTGTWTASFFARIAGDNQWTQVGGPEDILDENIGAIGIGIGSLLTADIVSLKLYEDTSPATESGREARFFLSQTQPAVLGQGTAYDGTTGFSCLKAGFVLRELAGVGSNMARLGGATDGEADSQLFSDATLLGEVDEIDLRLLLDTNPAIWEAAWYAKHPNDTEYTLVRPAAPLLDQMIGGIGFSSDNTDMLFEVSSINVSQEDPV